MARRAGVAERLPEFPWDVLEPYALTAAAHPDEIVDLSVGTPVDPTPELIRTALAAGADAPGYPTTHGHIVVREAAARWLARRLGVTVEPAHILPVIGTKEIVASLPALLGLGPGDRVVFPELAYPTYEVGARLANATPTASDSASDAQLIWVNSPANPTGRVWGAGHLRKVVRAARVHGAIVASDECYIELGWDADPVSILHPSVADGSHDGLLAVHSLSKRSNLAGYRAGLVAGDPDLVRGLLDVRKHAGMMVPAPVQAAMVAALSDDEHVRVQRARYSARRATLRAAFEAAGFTIEHSEAGLYLWATRGEPCWETVADLAKSGILVAPGEFYGPAGARHVRIALTATDERVAAAVTRLT